MSIRAGIAAVALAFSLFGASLAVAERRAGSIEVLDSQDRGGGLSIVGTDRDDHVTVDLGDTGYTISADAPLTSPNCTATSDQSLECPRFSSRLVASLRSGDDTLHATGEATGKVLRGGDGDDTLTGGSASNAIDGDDGSDTLLGRGGNDHLYGDAGRDRIAGGGGDDYLYALDGRRDKSIRCGGGSDVAIVDRGQDPMPTGCEVVKQRTFDGPRG